MMSAKNYSSTFSRSVWMLFVVLVVSVFVFSIYVLLEKQIERANELRYQSLLLAHELRQSSDDLTRMVRSYVITGHPLYKQNYQEILDIRNGKKPRPVRYHDIYWDLVLADDQRPRPYSGQAIGLLQQMQQAGFTKAEFARLALAKANSDALTNTEFAAMKLVESTDPPTETNRSKAILMLHDTAYHQAKAAIMRPINEFSRMSDQRTLDVVHAREIAAMLARALFIFFGLMLFFMLWRAHRILHAILGGSVDELHTRIARLGRGEFLSTIPVAKGMENSVLGWLSETQIELTRIDADRRVAETERKRAEEALINSESRLHTLIQTIPDIIWLKDKDGIYLSCNSMFERFFGAREADIVGKTDYDFVDRELADSFRGHDREAVAAGKPTRKEDWITFADDGHHALMEAIKAPMSDSRGTLIGVLGIGRDITERKRVEDALQRSETKFRTLYDSTSDAVMLLDEKGFIDCNKVTLVTFGCATKGEFCSKHPADLSPPQQPCGTNSLLLANQMIATAMEKGSIHFEWMHKRNDTGETFPADVLLTAMELDGKPVVQAVVRDITERKRAEEKIQQMAHHDSLTGLPNRTLLVDRLTIAMNQAERNRKKVALMMLDLDKFKEINDTLGHHIGDLLLQAVAERLAGILRKGDTIARFGGDEFVLVLPEQRDALTARQVASKIIEAFRKAVILEGHTLIITSSIGISLYPDHGADIDTILKNADNAMYQAKQAGRNRYKLYDEG